MKFIFENFNITKFSLPPHLCGEWA